MDFLSNNCRLVIYEGTETSKYVTSCFTEENVCTERLPTCPVSHDLAGETPSL